MINKVSISRKFAQSDNLPSKFGEVRFVMKGIMAIKAPKFEDYKTSSDDINQLIPYLEQYDLNQIPLRSTEKIYLHHQ